MALLWSAQAVGASGGATATEWTNGSHPVVLADMSRCLPTAALSPTARHAHWKVLDYEARPYQGKLVWASERTDAPEVTLPLHTQGWNAIYVGLADPAGLGCTALLRLTRDPAFVPRTRTSGQIEEVFFKAADLTGQDLHFRQRSHGHARGCGIAYVKLVPLTPAEVDALQADQRDTTHHRLTATIDGFTFFHNRKPTTRQDLLEEIESYRDTDFDSIILQMGGADFANYPSQVGQMIGQDLDDFPRPGDRDYAEAIHTLAQQHINPTKVLLDGAHALGMKVSMGIRPGAWVYTEPFAEFFTSRFYREHPEWRTVDKDGTVVPRMSFAVPEVRAHLTAMLREAVQMGADGATLIFVRGVPFTLYEKPFCDLFQQRFGVEATSVPEDDPRLLRLRSDLATDLMHEVRAMLDAEGQKRHQRLTLSAFVLTNEVDNLRYGLDVRRWVAEGLLDAVYPYNRAAGNTTRVYDMKFFSEVCGPKGIPVRPTFISWDPADMAKIATDGSALYAAGADGLTVWDANFIEDASLWSLTTRLGHRDELRQHAQEGMPQPVTFHFHSLAGTVMDGRFEPNRGY
jgi:hypothetical protein